MKFKVLYGKHRDGNKVFKRGEIVESDRDLTKVFKNKFEKLESRRRSKQAEEEAETEAEEIEEEPGPGVKLKAVHKGGGHYVVINEETGERLNDEYLNKTDALAMVGE